MAPRRKNSVRRGGILDTLKEMSDKAEGTLTDARGTEMKSKHASQQLLACSDSITVSDYSVEH